MTDQAAAGGPGSVGPLAGLQVIAVEQYGAGPLGTLFLADLGADIVKVEDPRVGGDTSRSIPPGQSGTDSLFFEAFNRGKRSIALDLAEPDDRAIFDRLVAGADAVFNNLRGDGPAELGLTYARLGAINPAIVCVSLSAFGSRGAEARLPGYDALIQARAGWASITGEPDGPPVKSGLPLADYVAGLTAALGLLAKVLDARRTGIGGDVETNLYDAALSMLSYQATWYLSSGYEHRRRPGGAHGSVVPFQFFETADGHIAIAAPKEKFFRALLGGMGLDALADDPRFASFDARLRHRDALLTILAEALRLESSAVWLSRLEGRVPVAEVRTMPAALDPGELADREMLAEYRHSRLGTVRSVGSPLRMSGYRPVYRPGPDLDGDRAALLAGLGSATLAETDPHEGSTADGDTQGRRETR